jgi:hypothetical protein
MQNIFGQIALPSMRGVLNSKVPTTMYSGGKGLGTAQQGVIQNNCPPEQIQTIYYGGNGYGNQQEIIVQNICVAPPIETIFYGGIGYGNQQQNTIQAVCTAPPIESIFYGGIGYGNQQQNIIQAVCTAPPIESIFYGGAGFGNNDQKLVQTNCSLVPIPVVTTTTIPFYNYFDLETATLCSGPMCNMSPSAANDLRFAYNSGGTVHARMWWNEQYADMALVYDKTFNQLTAADIPNYYYCDHINDGNPACFNTDTPPTNFVGVYKTNSGNYYAVQYLSENSTTVTFKYKKLN